MKLKISAAATEYFSSTNQGGPTVPLQSGDITIMCYQNEIPSFVHGELERIYENVFSSLKQFRIYSGHQTRINTYVARRGMEIEDILLFQVESNKVRVMNEVIELGQETIKHFSDYIFKSFNDIDVIQFHAIQTGDEGISYPVQRHSCSEDIILELPESEKAYLDMLGKNTRRNLKRYGEKLLRDHPSFEFSVQEKGEVDEQHIRDIVALNKARMAEKNKESIIDDSETDRMIRLVKEYGRVGVAKIDGKVCAGSISYCIGSNCYLSVISHDPAYDPYWIGILTCYNTIVQCIRNKATKFHFLWGRYEYKFTLMAKLHDLHDLTIYRSRLCCFLNPVIFVKSAIAGQRRRIQMLMHETKHQHQHDIWTRTFVSYVRAMRGVVHSICKQWQKS